ncbi:MAG TPA: polysaccharide biosynthesis tyrosine autokinase [Armatimonadota bacterium]
MEPQQHLSLRDYGRVISKRWKVVAAFAILGLAAGAFTYYTSAKAFKATSEVLVERPSGYSISGMGAGILGSGLNTGSALSTKQASHFVETNSYQQIARALTDLAPRIPLDLTDSATLDDISTVIQTDVLDSEYVTPVRIALYDQPSASLESFQQTKVIKMAPALRKNLDTLARIANTSALSSGWSHGRPGRSDHAVRENMRQLADSAMLKALGSLGVTGEAGASMVSATDAPASTKLSEYAKVALAAKLIGILSDLDEVSGTAKKRGSNITQSKSSSEVLTNAGTIMTSKFVEGLEFGPGHVDWLNLSPKEKQDAILKAGDGLNVWHGKHMSKSELVWDVSAKEGETGTDIVTITQTAPTADQARLAANAMAAVMVWQDRMTKVANDERSVRFLKAQIGDDNSGASRTLRIREDQLAEYQRTNRLVDSATQLKSAAEEAASLDADRGKARVEIADARASLGNVLQQLGGPQKQRFVIAPNIKLNAVKEGLRSDLIKAETELAGLRAQGFTDEWPAVMSAKAQLANLQRRLNAQFKDSIEQQFTPEPVHFALAGKAADLAATIVGLEARQTALGRLIGEMDNRFSALPGKEARMLRLMRAESLAEREYQYLNERLIDAKSNRVIRQGNARVIAVATAPGEKSAPRMRNVIALFLLGAFLGCLCAFALSAIDVHLRTAEDVQRELKLPVLAHLPAIPAGNVLIVESEPASEITEGFRSLRSSVRFAGGDTPPRSIAATAVRAGDAKSAVVANLAASLAQAGLTITAMDADLRRPRLASYFGSNASSGLADVLSAGAPARDARQATRIPGLYVLPAGTVSSGASELLENGRFGAALDDLAEVGDLVVIDTAPIGVVSDAAIIASLAASTILVIEAGTITPDEARSAVAKLTTSGRAQLIGVVLVGGDAPRSADYRHYSASSESGAPAGKTRKSGA